jgi:carboxypeptidase Taq
MMPKNSEDARNKQKAALAGVIFEKRTSQELGRDIALLSNTDTKKMNENDRAILRDASRDYNLQTRKSKDMAMRAAELEGRGFAIWAQARATNDWQLFKSILPEIISMKKEIAQAIHPDLSVYDAVIDEYERGMCSARLDEVFSSLKPDLKQLLEKILACPSRQKYVIPDALKGGPQWSVSAQKDMCVEVAAAMGFDFTRGRLDESVHPFTGMML